MRVAPGASECDPPRWAETVLRALLDPRCRDDVSGDLLEEYREAILPVRGVLGARVWYVRQVVGFARPSRMLASAIRSMTGGDMTGRASHASWWLAGAVVGLTALVGALIVRDFGPPLGLNVMVALALALAAAGMVSVRGRGDARSLWRSALVWGLLLAAVLVARLLVETLAPVDPLDRLLARVRSDYSELDNPRRWLPALAIALVLMTAAGVTAARTRRVWRGVLAAMAASLVGSSLYAALVALGNTLPMGAHDPLGQAPADLQFFGNVPSMLIPVLLMFSSVLGAIGAMFGRGLATTASGKTV